MSSIKTIYDEYNSAIGKVQTINNTCYVASILDDDDKDRQVMFGSYVAAEQYVKDFVAATNQQMTISQYLRTLSA
jgi:hypothetical protein